MKKFISILILLAMCLTFSGCFGNLGSHYIEEYYSDYTIPTLDPNIPTLIPADGDSDLPNIREEVEDNMQAIDEIFNNSNLNPDNSTTGNPFGNNNSSDDAHVHHFSPSTCMDWGKCECGAVNIEDPILGHDYSEPTCTDPKICRRCGKTTGKPTGHQYSNGVCIYCSAAQDTNSSGNHHGNNNSHNSGNSNTHSHNYAPATCTDPQICTCGATQGYALGHNYVNGKCSRCGLTSRVYLIEDIDYVSYDGIHYDMDRQQDNEGNEFSGHYHFYDLDLLSGPQIIDFYLNGNYSQFSGTIYLPYEDRGSDNTSTISIYGDGKLLYQSQDIEKYFKTEYFTVDVRGVSVLVIEFDGISYSLGQLTDAYLTQ